MFDRLKRWWSDKTPDPRTLVRNTIEHDPFDRDDLTEVMGAMGALQRARQNLQDVSPVGGELLDDLVFSMVRVRPKLADQETVAPDHQPNWQVMNNAMDLPDWHRLHAETKGDPWFAGMAATALAPTVLDLASKNSEAQEQASELDGTMQTLADATAEQESIEEQLQSLEPGTAEAEAAQQQLDDLATQIDQLSQQGQAQAGELERSLTMSSLEVSAAMQEAIGQAADQVSEQKATCALWGTQPGELQRMSAEEHMRLAERLNNDKLRELTKRVGGDAIRRQRRPQPEVPVHPRRNLLNRARERPQQSPPHGTGEAPPSAQATRILSELYRGTPPCSTSSRVWRSRPTAGSTCLRMGPARWAANASCTRRRRQCT
jgi:hypothetical protein